MKASEQLERVPRGTLVVSISVAWTLLLLIGGFAMGDVWNRLHDAEIAVAKVQSDHETFEDWLTRVDAKLDKVIYDKLGVTFDKMTSVEVELRYEESKPVKVH